MTDRIFRSPTIIPEIGANHDGSAEVAHQMLDELAAVGAQFAKFQLYTSDELVAQKDRLVKWGPPGRQTEETLGSMFDRVTLPWDQMKDLYQHGADLGLNCFATPFSKAGVDFLEDLNTPLYKIASSDVTYLELIEYIGSTGKPVILSVGKSTLAEVDDAVRALEGVGCSDLTILHCVAGYPTPYEDSNLRNIEMLQLAYPRYGIGLSDHSEGTVVSVAALARGAQVIERHVTLSRERNGPDHWFSITMDEVKDLINAAEIIPQALGSTEKIIQESEKAGSVAARRSIIANRSLKAGSVVTEEDVKIVRPATGIAPRDLPNVIGMTVQQDVEPDVPLDWTMFK